VFGLWFCLSIEQSFDKVTQRVVKRLGILRELLSMDFCTSEASSLKEFPSSQRFERNGLPQMHMC
jgi:hypothetical protein